MSVCEFCNAVVSSKYVLKNHLLTNKTCLSNRKIEPKTFKCDGCFYKATNQQKLSAHKENCKAYQILLVTETLTKKHKEDLYKKDLIICELQKSIDENKDISIKHTELKVLHKELIKQHEELKQQYEKTINKLEMKISQCDTFIQTIAREGSNKPTTNNTINVRNQLSSTFTLDNLEPKKLEETMREHYTERDFFGGQKRLANFFLEKVIKTPDDKMLICCTDTSRKKFKILDLRGNLKEDI